MIRPQKPDDRGIGHILLILGIFVVIGLVGFAFNMVRKANGKDTGSVGTSQTPTKQTGIGYNPNDIDSLDPVKKGMAMTYGKCDGKGATTMTHAPMNAKDISTIAPEGGYGGAHVTPIDHQYYYGLDQKAAPDTYPVYAVMDGNVNAVGNVVGAKTTWNLTLSHSCTFMVYYNLMTSLAPAINSKLPDNWRITSGNVKIPVKAGDLIGYSGGQSLDFQLANTEKTLPGLLYHTAYNAAEPIKINGVRPLDYYSNDVKTAILPKYLRTTEPRDGKYDYDAKGQAVGNWFLAGTNGYSGPTGASDEFSRVSGHLALAYDSIDTGKLVFSTGNYQGKPQQFAVKGKVDWTKITKNSGLTKVQLAEGSLQLPNGTPWNGQFATGITFNAAQNMATVLLQMTDDLHLKVEILPGKTVDQVSGFSANAATYDRGQTARLVESTTRSHQ